MAKRTGETDEQYKARHREEERLRRLTPEWQEKNQAYKQTDEYKAKHAEAERERRKTKQVKAYDREYRREYREKNREKFREYSREHQRRRRAKLKADGLIDPWNTPDRQRAGRLKDPARFSAYNRKRTYGFTREQQDALFATQDGHCANKACNVKLELFGKGSEGRHLDHNHDTLAVRSWLCSACNGALGRLENVKREQGIVARLRGLADYVEGHSSSLAKR